MNESAGVGPRRQDRETVLGLLYEGELTGRTPAETLDDQPVPVSAYIAEFLAGIGDNLDDIDALLERHSIGWTVARMPALDRLILRMGAFELLCQPDVPTGVVLSEAADLAGSYSTEKSAPFVNGVLDAIAAEVRTP